MVSIFLQADKTDLGKYFQMKVEGYLYGPSPMKAIRASGSLSITLLHQMLQMSRAEKIHI